jgi:hypothetical protein
MKGFFISRMECMSAKAGAESGRFPGWNVCPRRQELRADDFQDGMYVREGKARADDVLKPHNHRAQKPDTPCKFFKNPLRPRKVMIKLSINLKRK